MENKLVIRENDSLLLNIGKFEHAQRVGKMLTQSTMVPEHFRGNIGNCVIALNYADRAGIDPFMAMQKMYIIHGKPAVETQLQIALFNKSKRFTTLKFELGGKDDESYCLAHAVDVESNEKLEGPKVTIGQAKKEGWYNKKGSKWQTLPELMLRYRAAAFFIRIYAPETTLGLYTSEEMYDSDIIDVTPDNSVQDEINENANSDIIDIKNESGKPDEKKSEDGTGLSEEEKKDIQEKEDEESKIGPDSWDKS